MSLGQKKNIITENHIKATRDYSERATPDKAKYSELAKKFDFEYWDGDRKTGYGGYKNDGRWQKVAKKLDDIYSISQMSNVLDVGCGKGYLLSELKKNYPQLNVCGVDVSAYALKHASPDVAEYLTICEADKINFPEKAFDLVVSINCLHNLELPELFLALDKIQRVSNKNSFICVESYRNEIEKWNLLQWQLTCEAFYTPKEWEWIFEKAGYTGDYEFIFFE